MKCECCWLDVPVEDIYYVNSGDKYKLRFIFVCKTCKRDTDLKKLLDKEV